MGVLYCSVSLPCYFPTMELRKLKAPSISVLVSWNSSRFLYYFGMFHKKNKGILSKKNFALYLAVAAGIATMARPGHPIHRDGFADSKPLG